MGGGEGGGGEPRLVVVLESFRSGFGGEGKDDRSEYEIRTEAGITVAMTARYIMKHRKEVASQKTVYKYYTVTENV